MKYKNAQDILPDKLLKELQQYVSGETLYVPNAQTKKGWGTVSGSRRYYQERNDRIIKKFKSGSIVEDLAEEFNLSVDSIRKIVYGN
ncbi:MAG TPA: hypothetical protein H9671_06490 [Firmicutes bacterium]|nr:hypothetical protein [Bacillota bacterium]